MFSTPILYHTARKHVNGRIAKLSRQILCIFELIKTFMNLFSGKTLEKKRRCKKSATKPVDSLDMEAHGL